MINISAIAADHNITTEELNKWVVGRGWDFSSMDMSDESHVKFATDVVTRYAQDIAERQTKVEAARKAQQTAFTAKWETPTKASLANPRRSCKRCNGTGKVITFSHVEGGVCFRCEGTGVK